MDALSTVQVTIRVRKASLYLLVKKGYHHGASSIEARAHGQGNGKNGKNDPQESSGKREELTQLRLCILLYERLEFATLAHVPMYQRRRNLQAGRKGAGRDLRVKY